MVASLSDLIQHPKHIPHAQRDMPNTLDLPNLWPFYFLRQFYSLLGSSNHSLISFLCPIAPVLFSDPNVASENSTGLGLFWKL